MALFLSASVNKIDQKGRVSVPATFRAELQKPALLDKYDFNGIIVFRSFREPMLEACGIDRIHEMSEQLEEMSQFSDDYDSLSTIFSDANRVLFDGEGRVILPKSLLEFAHITDSVQFVGRGPTFQLWEPEAFRVRDEAKRARASERNLSFPPRRKPAAS